MKKSIIIAVAAVAASMVIFTACAPADVASEKTETQQVEQISPSVGLATLDAQTSTLTVSATEKVSVKPDVARVSLGVKTSGNDAQDAQQKNAIAVEAMLNAIKQQGVKEEDVQTSYVNLYQDYENPNMYIMENTYEVTIRDINNAGKVIDAAIAAGANTSYSLSFDISNRDAAYIEALGKAMTSIGAKAEAVAKSGGYAIIRPQSIVEGGTSSYDYPMPMAEAAAAAGETGRVTTPITPGDIDVSASVTGAYYIQ